MIKPQRIRNEVHVAWMEKKRKAYRLFVGKPEKKRPQGRPRRSALILLR
jgi:hypothetical protein